MSPTGKLLSLPNGRLERLQRELKRAVFRTCPVWMRDQAEDIVQLSMIRLLRVIERKGGEENINNTYLKRIAYSVTIDEIRRRKIDREVSMEVVVPPPQQMESGPERNATSRQIGEAIQGCLQHVRQTRRQAVTLYLQGHSIPEIGVLLGWNEKRSENLVYRGRSDLQSCLKKKGIVP